jgi:hypothetical protein
MNNVQDLCVKYVRDWNRIDKMIGCRHLSMADQAVNECVRDGADDFLFTAKPESLAGAGDLVQHGAQAFSGAITSELQHALFSIGARLRQGKSSLADVVALRRAIAACDCEPYAMEAGELDMIEAGYKADVLAMLRRALGFMTRPQLV